MGTSDVLLQDEQGAAGPHSLHGTNSQLLSFLFVFIGMNSTMNITFRSEDKTKVFI